MQKGAGPDDRLKPFIGPASLRRPAVLIWLLISCECSQAALLYTSDNKADVVSGLCRL